MKKRYILLVIILLLLAYLVMRGALNYSGFCWAEKRWLSDEELLRAMIETVNNNPDPYGIHFELKEKYGSNTYQHIPYASVDDFLAKNPNCCKFDNTPQEQIWGGDWIWQILGDNGASATIDYNLHYIMPNNIKKSFQTTEHPFAGNCGKVFNENPN